MNQYVRFAEVYDKMKADRHSIRMAEYTLELIRRFDMDITDALDLCCGTGSAIELFAGHGFNMDGLDGSKHMLNVARKKLAGLGVKLYCQALPHFRVTQPGKSNVLSKFDLVTSFYDSLNYMLTRADLKAAFRAAFRHLNPGGWFIFDMNTAHGLKTIWDEQIYAGEEDDLAWIWKNFYDPRTQIADCDATFFVKKGRHWQRFHELHRERAYSNADIKRMLRDVGFTVKGFYNCLTFDSPSRDSYRIAVVARRR